MLMPAASASPLPTVLQQPNGTTTPTTATITGPTVTAMQPAVIPASALQTAAALQTVLPQVQHPSQKDTTWTKLFVGGLPYHTTDKSLREHFEVYGEIEEAVVITDRQTGKSRGYGFVIMAQKEAAERACKEPNPMIDGRKANVNLAILGAKPRGNAIQGLPLTALRTGYATLLPQYGDLSLVLAAQQLGASGGAASTPAAATAALSPGLSGPTAGKARSSMSLQLMSGRLPASPTGAAAPSAAANPYLYAAASNPYAGLQTPTGIFPLQAAAAAQNPFQAGSTGNPILDAYASQYAAAVAAMGYAPTATTMGAVTAVDASQTVGTVSYAGFPTGYAAYAPALQAGAYATAVPTTGSQPGSTTPTAAGADGRIQ